MALHLVFGSLIPGHRAHRQSELAALAEHLDTASHLLYPNLPPPAEATREVTDLGDRAIGLRRELETRLARAAVHRIDPRLLCDAASEMVEVMRLITRVIRCRAWLGLETVPGRVLELEAIAGQGVQLVAESARELATSGAPVVDLGRRESIRRRAEELYNQGVSQIFAGNPDPLEVLRQKTFFEALFNLVIGGDRALEVLKNASAE